MAMERPPSQFIVFSQNHDQIGNRAAGDRLSRTLSLEKLKLAAGMVVLSPYIPLLFMGEEYGETVPFQYFVSHSDEALIASVREGRRKEFESFLWHGEVPDPQDAETFRRSKLDWKKKETGDHRVLLDFYKRIIRLRKETPALSRPDRKNIRAQGFESEMVLLMTRWNERSRLFCAFNFNEADIKVTTSPSEGTWRKILDSSSGTWNGPGPLSPDAIKKGGVLSIRGSSFVVYEKEE
ncbi:MAG: DUF3459 domain-containing protein [Nitrospinae bacterium]|nr:DUF3459 domain-containing protein [Nitrospinota bacterium]